MLTHLSIRVSDASNALPYLFEQKQALTRLGRISEMHRAHAEAARLGVWPSAMQRPMESTRDDDVALSAFSVAPHPWWTVDELGSPTADALCVSGSVACAGFCRFHGVRMCRSGSCVYVSVCVCVYVALGVCVYVCVCVSVSM